VSEREGGGRDRVGEGGGGMDQVGEGGRRRNRSCGGGGREEGRAAARTQRASGNERGARRSSILPKSLLQRFDGRIQGEHCGSRERPSWISLAPPSRMHDEVIVNVMTFVTMCTNVRTFGTKCSGPTQLTGLCVESSPRPTGQSFVPWLQM